MSSSSAPLVSFEFFPPKTPEMEIKLWQAIQRLAPLKPRFVSVTYGAGGSTRERTHATIRRILTETDLIPAPHLTCVGASALEIDGILRDYLALGVRHIVALRGDPPLAADGTPGPYAPHPEGYAYASDLVAGIHRLAPFEISVAAYPETHPEAVSAEVDLDNLKRKIDAGATRAITQCFFDTDRYLRFMDRVRAKGITVPVVPGILPVINFAQAQKFGASIPQAMRDLFEHLDNDPETRKRVAIDHAVEICQRLRANGIEEFHFYTLNRADLTLAICHVLGVDAPSTAFAGA